MFAPVVKLGAMRAPGDLDGCAEGSLERAVRIQVARGLQQRAVGGLMDRIGSRGAERFHNFRVSA